MVVLVASQSVVGPRALQWLMRDAGLPSIPCSLFDLKSPVLRPDPAIEQADAHSGGDV
jgi:hypothetical protein